MKTRRKSSGPAIPFVYPSVGLAAVIRKFRFLKPALILILAFVGVKLLLLSVPPYLGVLGMQKSEPIKIDTTASLLVVVGALAIATVLSVLVPSKPPQIHHGRQ